jgi:L-ascorbate metabolism protein UlaG (beta-lactamase superfamily)
MIGSAGIDVAVVPIGDLYTMGPDASIEAIKLVDPRRVLPAHYNTWPPIEQDAEAWASQVRAETYADPIVLEPGGHLAL